MGDSKLMGIWDQRLFDCACSITTLERKHSAKGRQIVVPDRCIFRKATLQIIRERQGPGELDVSPKANAAAYSTSRLFESARACDDLCLAAVTFPNRASHTAAPAS